MMVHRHKCEECGESADLLKWTADFAACPFCGAEGFPFDGTVGVVRSPKRFGDGE